MVYATFLILFVTTIVGSTPANITSALHGNIEIVNDIDAYRSAHSNIKLIPFDVTTTTAGVLTHILGTRTKRDRVIITGSQKNSYPVPQTVNATLKYPTVGGYGEKVTSVVISVAQTSNKGRAYVRSGGIGQRNIEIVVEASDTLKFDCTATFYNGASRLQSVGLLVSLVSLLLFAPSILNL